MPVIETGSTNVYAGLGRADAGEMLVKTQLASKIGDILKRKKLTQLQATEITSLPQPKLSLLPRGQFRRISEARMMECPAWADVQIVVGPARRAAGAGRVKVVTG